MSEALKKLAKYKSQLQEMEATLVVMERTFMTNDNYGEVADQNGLTAYERNQLHEFRTEISKLKGLIRAKAREKTMYEKVEGVGEWAKQEGLKKGYKEKLSSSSDKKSGVLPVGTEVETNSDSTTFVANTNDGVGFVFNDKKTKEVVVERNRWEKAEEEKKKKEALAKGEKYKPTDKRKVVSETSKDLKVTTKGVDASVTKTWNLVKLAVNVPIPLGGPVALTVGGSLGLSVSLKAGGKISFENLNRELSVMANIMASSEVNIGAEVFSLYKAIFFVRGVASLPCTASIAASRTAVEKNHDLKVTIAKLNGAVTLDCGIRFEPAGAFKEATDAINVTSAFSYTHPLGKMNLLTLTGAGLIYEYGRVQAGTESLKVTLHPEAQKIANVVMEAKQKFEKKYEEFKSKHAQLVKNANEQINEYDKMIRDNGGGEELDEVLEDIYDVQDNYQEVKNTLEDTKDKIVNKANELVDGVDQYANEVVEGTHFLRKEVIELLKESEQKARAKYGDAVVEGILDKLGEGHSLYHEAGQKLEETAENIKDGAIELGQQAHSGGVIVRQKIEGVIDSYGEDIDFLREEFNQGYHNLEEHIKDTYGEEYAEAGKEMLYDIDDALTNSKKIPEELRKKFDEKLLDGEHWVKESFKNAKNTLENIPEDIDYLKKETNQAYHDLEGHIKDQYGEEYVEAGKEMLYDAGDEIQKKKNAAKKQLKKFKKNVKKTKASLEKNVKKGAEVVQEKAEELKESVEETAVVVKNKLEQGAEELKDNIEKGAESIKETVVETKEKAAKKLEEFGDSVEKGAKAVKDKVNNLKDTAAKKAEQLEKDFDKGVDNLKDKAEKGWNKLKSMNPFGGDDEDEE